MPIPTCECIKGLSQAEKLDAIYCTLLTISEGGGDTSQFVTLTGEQTVTDKTFTSPIINEILDANGNEAIVIVTTGSAVNEITVTNAATGNAPVIAATGGDTNIGLTIAAKGTGIVSFSSNIEVPDAHVTGSLLVDTGCNVQGGSLEFAAVGAMADTPVADGTYTVGKGAVTDGTITTANGVIIAIQQASDV